MNTFNIVDLGWTDVQVKQGLELTLDKMYVNHEGDFVCSDEVLCFDGVWRNEDDCIFCDNIQHFAPCDAVVAGEDGYEFSQELYDALSQQVESDNSNGSNVESCEMNILKIGGEVISTKVTFTVRKVAKYGCHFIVAHHCERHSDFNSNSVNCIAARSQMFNDVWFC